MSDYYNYINYLNNYKKSNISIEDKLDFLIGKTDDKAIYEKLSLDEEKRIIDKYSTDN